MTRLSKTITLGALCGLMTAGPAQAIDPNIAQAAQDAVTAARTESAPTNGTSGGTGGLLGSIFGCSASGNSQTIGAVAGGAVGGLLGNRIAGSGSRTLGTILGGALGAAAGSALGCKLQKNDRDRAERATQAAIASGKAQDWSNSETGASGRVDVSDSAGQSIGDLRFAEGVEPASGFSKVANSYVTTTTANLRGAPATTAAVRAKLPAGQRVWVPAAVTGKPWMLVAEGGTALGYVSTPLLKRVTTVASNCRIVKQEVNVPGEAAASESYQACKDKTGAWVMTRV